MGATDRCRQIETFPLRQTPLQTHSLTTLIGAVRPTCLTRSGGYRPHFDRPGGLSRYTLRGIGVFTDNGIAGVNRANGIDFQSTAAALAALRYRDHLL